MPLVSKTFSQIITFTRASTATFFDATGTLQSAAIDAPRFDYDPSTLAAQGLLIEEARTNGIRNNTMVGAVAGTPGTIPTNWQIAGAGVGTLNRDIVGTGTTAGIAYIDVRYYGTTSTTNVSINFEPNISSVAATAGQTWTGSNYLAIVGGSIANLTFIRGVILTGRTSGGGSTADAVNSGDQKAVLTATMQRFSASITLADATTASLQTGVALTFSSGVAIDITLRIGLPQLEQGAFATSVIPTTTTALTRSADVASVNTLSPWYNSASGTLYAEFSSNISPSSTNIVQASFNDATANNRFSIQSSTSARALRNTGGAGLVSTPQTANAPVSGINKVALAVATADAAICLNGGTVATDTVTAYAVPTVTQLQLGFQLSAAYLNGWLRRATYYPRKLSSAELQTLTT